MGCCGSRSKVRQVTEEQKWQYLNLGDFKSKSCLTPFSYIWIWILALTTVAVYGVDTFTAVNLLAFNRWSSQVEPAIPFEISKWIFAACIMFSWILCFIEWFQAVRVIRGDGVADSYLDPLAAVIQSSRPGKYQGWKRFLVFAELTKSRKGMDYICLFVYFSFKGAVRIILAEGPRQVVNGVTIYSVVRLNLVPVGENAATEDRTAIAQFFKNIQILADTNRLQAVILSSMAFTLVIWVISALGLLIAFILYILIVWHYVPTSDGSLADYCRRKVDSRLDRIVSKTTKKAIEKQEAKRIRDEAKAVKKGEQRPGQLLRQPTLPTLSEDSDSTRLPSPTLSRVDTVSTLHGPSRMNTMTTVSTMASRQPNLPNIEPRPSGPSRTMTESSTYSARSFSSTAPLLPQAGTMGRQDAPPMPSLNRLESFGRPAMGRSMTGNSSRSFTPASQTQMAHLPRPNPAFGANGRNSPASSLNGNESGYNNRPPHPNNRRRMGDQRIYTPYSSETHSRSTVNNAYYENRAAHGGYDHAYEMSPVVSPVSATSRPAYFDTGPAGNNLYNDRTRTPFQRAQTATPAAMPPTGQHSAVQRRDVSTPLPDCEPGYERPGPTRSATAPVPHGFYQASLRGVTTTPLPTDRPDASQLGQSNWRAERGW